MCMRLSPDIVSDQCVHSLIMSVDFSAAGPPLAYPPRNPGFLPWLGIWALCCAIGSGFALLIWPASMPAQGPFFWFCVVGLPNGFFLFVLGCARAAYETAYLHALYGNQHRQNWMRERVTYAQQPLYVLAYAYHLPLGKEALVPRILSGKPLIAPQNTRTGVDRVLHMRFPDFESPLVDEADADHDSEAEIPETVEASDSQAGRVPQDGFGHVVKQVLIPLIDSLHTISRLGSKRMPIVRLATANPDAASSRVQQVRDTLAALGLPPFHCEAAPASDGLMLADTWLDALERRPLLVIAAEWHDTLPPPGSTEGGVAVLLSAGPSAGALAAVGTLHRPVAVGMDALNEGLSNAVLWGKTVAAKIKRSWISGFNIDDDATLASAFSEASLTGLDTPDTQLLPDRVIGHAGSGAGWLAIAAAIESGLEDPQLIINRTETVQSAVLYAHPRSRHEDRAE
jgi:hypothetical protein